MGIHLKRAYDPPSPHDGTRILVDRIWPRGVTKERAALDLWAKELAPSSALRKWFGHNPRRWEEFQRRYHAELEQHKVELDDLREQAATQTVTLVFGAKDRAHNQAVVLKQLLEKRT